MPWSFSLAMEFRRLLLSGAPPVMVTVRPPVHRFFFPPPLPLTLFGAAVVQARDSLDFEPLGRTDASQVKQSMRARTRFGRMPLPPHAYTSTIRPHIGPRLRSTVPTVSSTFVVEELIPVYTAGAFGLLPRCRERSRRGGCSLNSRLPSSFSVPWAPSVPTSPEILPDSRRCSFFYRDCPLSEARRLRVTRPPFPWGPPCPVCPFPGGCQFLVFLWCPTSSARAWVFLSS